MTGIRKVDVLLRFDETEIRVGQLVLDRREVLFKYNDTYLANGFNLSPIRLSFDNSIQTGPPSPFNGLFGVFSDSIPDAWGRLLIKRKLAAQQIAIESLNSLDYLMFVGSNGPGSLKYRPTVAEDLPEQKTIDLDALNEGAARVMEGESSEVIDDIFDVGGSPGGARPKVYAGYDSTSDSLIHGWEQLPEKHTHWIIKFAANVDAEDIANREMAYHRMALDAKIEMTECRLFTGRSGKTYFGTERFDRIRNNRIHMISAAGMFHDDYEHSQMDYGTLLHEAGRLINDARVDEQIFRRAVFNVYAHNRDDHSKNFAFLMDPTGNWRFAPAYDLTFSSSSQGMHSTTVARNGVNPGKKELMSLAEHFSIRKGEQIIEEVREVIQEWRGYAEREGVTKNSIDAIGAVLKRI